MDNIDIAYRTLEESRQRILSLISKELEFYKSYLQNFNCIGTFSLISYGFEVTVSAKNYSIWKTNPKEFPQPKDCQSFLNHLRSWVTNGIKDVIKTNPNESSQYLNLISLANQYDKIS